MTVLQPKIEYTKHDDFYAVRVRNQLRGKVGRHPVFPSRWTWVWIGEQIKQAPIFRTYDSRKQAAEALVRKVP